jgi:hypothetical protein
MQYTRAMQSAHFFTALLFSFASASMHVNRFHRGARLTRHDQGRQVRAGTANKGWFRTPNSTIHVKDMIDKIHLMARTDCSTAETFIDSIRELIVNQIKPQIIAAHEQARQALASVSTSLATCTSNYQAANTGISTIGHEITHKSQEHYLCRTTQANVHAQLSTCTPTVASAQEAMDSACGSLQQEYCATGDCCHPTISEPSTEEGLKAWILRNQQAFSEALEAYEDSYGRCTQRTSEYDELKAECDSTSSELHAQRQQCDTAQDALELAACTHSQLIVEQCTVYTGCLNGVLSSFEPQQSQIAQQEADRKAEWAAVINLECFLNVFDGTCTENPAAIAECEGLASNTTHLNLTFPEVPEVPSTCGDPNGAPCGNMYKAVHYSSLPVNAPPKACTPCPDGVIEADLTQSHE